MAELVYRSALKSGVIGFKATKSITRPATITQYTIGDLINGNGATTLIEFDFGTDYANQVIELNNASVISNNPSAATKLSAALYLINASTILGAGDASQVDDNAAFAPTMTQISAKIEGMFEDLSTTTAIGTTTYAITNNEKSVIAKLNTDGKIYIAMVANNAYTPASGEILRLTLKGYILG